MSMNAIGDIVEVSSLKSGPNPDPEGVVHDAFGVFKTADDPVFNTFVRRLLQQMPAKEQACADFLELKPSNQFIARDLRRLFHRQCKTKPRRIRSRR